MTDQPPKLQFYCFDCGNIGASIVTVRGMSCQKCRDLDKTANIERFSK